jgi:hAT family C-terminal dimerisation region
MSVENERVFSDSKNLISDRRNSLEIETIECLLNTPRRLQSSNHINRALILDSKEAFKRW